MEDTTSHSSAEIWNRLSSIDVNEWVDTKTHNQLWFLPWGSAWMLIMEHYPQLHVTYDYESTGNVYFFPDGSAEVKCHITINETHRSAYLPVMDNRMNADTAPDARAINDTKQRALVKTLALFGLGEYIFRGSKHPAGEPTDKPAEGIVDSLADGSESVSNGEDGEAFSEDNNKAALLLKVFAEESKDITELNTLFKSNKETIEQWKKTDPEAHQDLIQAFRTKRTSLKDEIESRSK